MNYDNIPEELRAGLWIRANGKKAIQTYATDEDKAAHMKPFPEALKNKRPKENLARLIDKAEGFVFVDLDGVRNAETGAITEAWAITLIEKLDTYTEVSASGKGFHLVARGTLPEDYQKDYPDPERPGHTKGVPVELKSGNVKNRLFTLTGDVYGTTGEIPNRQKKLEDLLQRCRDGEFGGPVSTGQPKKSELPTVELAEITEAEESLPPFPVLPGPLGQLVEGITDDLPYEHKALAALTYAGVAFSKRISLVTDPWLQTRFYSCMIGTAGSGKSAPDMEVRRAVADIFGEVKVELSIDSGPALVQALDETPRIILAPDELADQFEKAKTSTGGRNSLFGEFLRLYEGNETANRTKKTQAGGGLVEVKNAHFAIIGSATTERFDSMWRGTSAVASGLLSRFVFSYSERIPPRNKKANDEAAIAAAQAALSSALASAPKRLVFSSEAMNQLSNWRADEELPTRALDMAKRFALLIAATTGLTVLDEEAMSLGLAFADYQIAFKNRFCSGDTSSNVQAFENRIIKFLEKHGSQTQAIVINKVRPERHPGGYSDFNRAWSALVQAGKIQPTARESRKGSVVFTISDSV